MTEPFTSTAVHLEGALHAETYPRTARRQRPQRLSASVSEALIHRIVSGEYPVGSQLPPEPLLVDEFEVSRPVVREAVKILESAGLVSIRQGDGTIVRDRSLWSMLDPRVLHVALTYNVGSRLRTDASELRAELEGSLIAAAVGNLTDEDFAFMEKQLRIMDVATELSDLQQADLAFHHVYRNRSGNELKSSIVRRLVEEMPNGNSVEHDWRSMYDVANKHHWEIYNALRAERTDDAVDAITRHIREMWTWTLDNN